MPTSAPQPDTSYSARRLSSTQSPYAGQRTIARILGLPMRQVEVVSGATSQSYSRRIVPTISCSSHSM